MRCKSHQAVSDRTLGPRLCGSPNVSSWPNGSAVDELRRLSQTIPYGASNGPSTHAGTVKLANTARFSPSARSARARSAGARHRIPRDERLASQQPVVTSSQ